MKKSSYTIINDYTILPKDEYFDETTLDYLSNKDKNNNIVCKRRVGDGKTKFKDLPFEYKILKGKEYKHADLL